MVQPHLGSQSMLLQNREGRLHDLCTRLPCHGHTLPICICPLGCAWIHKRYQHGYIEGVGRPPWYFFTEGLIAVVQRSREAPSNFTSIIELELGLKMTEKSRDCNEKTLQPPLPMHKVHQLATKLHCHAMKSLNNITKTRHKIQLNNNSDKGGSDGGVTGRAAGFRWARRRPDCMADNPPDPH